MHQVWITAYYQWIHWHISCDSHIVNFHLPKEQESKLVI
jgi:hypothetical protein